MKFTRHLNLKDLKKLEYEVVSTELRVYLSRELQGEFSQRPNSLERKLILINKAYNLRNLPIYQVDLDGDYLPEEQSWINAEFELLFRRLNTIEFIEFLGDLIEHGYFDIEGVNDLLNRDALSFYYEKQSLFKIQSHAYETEEVVVKVESIENIVDTDIDVQDVPNMRVLVHRMQTALDNADYALVLHTSASIFETLAKHIVGIQSIQDSSLGSFFKRYRKDSGLPDTILDYILKIYKDRGAVPIAGHGHLGNPNITREQAVTLCEMTKAFVKIEHALQIPTQKSQD